jgi:SHS2 domain-containing protein
LHGYVLDTGSTEVAYRWIGHTGELEVELEASTEHGVFEAAFEAMRDVLSDGEVPQRLEIPIRIEGRYRATLLADWLGELAFLAETRGVVPDRLSLLELDEGGLRALEQGWEGSPPHLVKGVTYHRLRFEPAGAGWRARVVLDV